MPNIERVLLTGATGFVGSHVFPVLRAAGFQVVCATRDPDRARAEHPDREYVQIDLRDAVSTLAAMHGCQAAVYLVHSMADGDDYDKIEQQSAQNFARAAEQAGLARIVYLGGIQPKGKPSKHLQSRMHTGELLRAGAVPTIELQAAMVIGAGSESWRIVRDLAARLPFMILPRWLESRSQPIYIDDVAVAIREALRVPLERSAAFALPGPEILSARAILLRIAALLNLKPGVVRAPLISPRLSSYWIAFVTRADRRIARQLVEGLRSDLVAADQGFWRLVPQHQRVGFDEAARRALVAEERNLPFRSRLTEWLIHRVTPAGLKRDPGRAVL
jgi:uncharacterized protein YbjT (DUF2867 family)